VVEVIKRWCFQHHTDISGWAFLGYLLGLGRQPRQQEQSGGDGGDGEGGRIGVEGRKEAESVVGEVLDLVENLRLANESVWVFLRTVTASGLVGEEMVARYKEVQAKVLETALEPRDQAVLKAAVDWSERYRRRDGPRLGTTLRGEENIAVE
jgi:protein prenyltransferase alpha subunit repeat containing protein 1